MRTPLGYLRQIHRFVAPVVILPLIITLITGSLFQIAFLMGKQDSFYWMLDIHKGKFGNFNLEMVYPFLNAFGLLFMATTGVSMWLQLKQGKLG